MEENKMTDGNELKIALGCENKESLIKRLIKAYEENKELRCENVELKAHLRSNDEDSDRAYLRGRIEGLEFSIRCNGVSGGEVN